jgi:ligand-binding sensor domain-containing protein
MLSNLKLNRRRGLVLVALLIAVAGGALVLYFWKLNRAVSDAQKQQDAARRIEVTQIRLRAPSNDGLAVYLDSSDVRARATLHGTGYLATSGGLVATDESGAMKKRYTTLDGLTDNDLTALAVFRDKLYIGTSSQGLMSFDGNVFTGYGFTKPKAVRVQTLAETESELLIGTLDGGLFEYDGERFSRRFNTTEGADFVRVTSLLPLDSRLYIGTQDKGLYIWREAHIEHVGVADGLPSPHVTGLAPVHGRGFGDAEVAIATDFGVVGLSDKNEIKPISGRPNITSLAESGGRLWAGLFGGGITELKADGRPDRGPNHGDAGQPMQTASRDLSESNSFDVAGLPRSASTLVSAGEDRLWALTSAGAYYREDGASGPGFQAVARSLSTDRILSEGHITGLALDGAGRLWIGYFDAGIDTVEPETGERLSHMQDDRLREINFVRYDQDDHRMLAATSRGLVIFDARLKESTLTREQSGLISDSVAHVSLMDLPDLFPAPKGDAGPTQGPQNRAMVLATAAGLTELSGGKARSLTAFHGLASNHLYTSAAVGHRLFVGTLAGLVELEGLTVLRTYTTSNSHLSHDWVTALADVDGTLYIGTNGGGVDALLPTGEFINFSDDIGRFEVNQNAIHLDGERLYIGTSDRGLLVYNVSGRRWTHFSQGLPSQSVTAITSDDRYVYAGTLNGLMRIEKRVIQ